MNDNRQIPMPSPEERAAAIGRILDLGLPARRAPAWHTLPLSALFFGVEDCLFLAALLSALSLIPAAAVSARSAPQGSFPALLFLTSPALYALPHLLTLWKDAMSGTLDWKRTCRIPPGTVLALRMLLFGGTAAAVSGALGVLCWQLSGQRFSLPWILGLAFSSLFLYAALSLALRGFRLWGLAAPPALWLALGLILLRWDRGSRALLETPALVLFLAAGGALSWYLRSLGRMIHPMKGATPHAVC